MRFSPAESPVPMRVIQISTCRRPELCVVSTVETKDYLSELFGDIFLGNARAAVGRGLPRKHLASVGMMNFYLLPAD